MALPIKHKQIFDELIRAFRVKPLRPPTLINGEMGTGKSWLIQELLIQLKKEFTQTFVWPIYVPNQLSGYQLVENIVQRISVEKNESLDAIESAKRIDPSKIRYVLLMENIDVLFNIKTSEVGFSRPKKVGRGSSQHSQVQHANELRRFLIENSSRVSLIATASEDISFTQDPEQPFYEFFNIIPLSRFEPQQCVEYFRASVRGLCEDKDINEFLEIMNSFNLKWIYHITDGKISLLNLLGDSFFQILKKKNYKKKDARIINLVLDRYFIKSSPVLLREIDKLSYSEKALLDRIVLLGNNFSGSAIAIKEFNASLFVQQLCKKRILEKDGVRKQSTYSLNSMALKAWLRFSKKMPLSDVLDPVKNSTNVN